MKSTLVIFFSFFPPPFQYTFCVDVFLYVFRKYYILLYYKYQFIIIS
nr:MAG TPA: hypothetical protein [Caudoviricetes sp.]